jgi:hypothetical protein
MGLEILISIFAGLISLTFGGVVEKILKPLYPEFEKIYNSNPKSFKSKIISAIFDLQPKSIHNYSTRITTSLENLKKASLEIDKVMNEFAIISTERQQTISSMELKLKELTEKEIALKSKIHTLEKIPLEAIQHFENALNKGDKRSAYRDYTLFGLGVIVSVVVTIVLKLVGF